MCFKIQLFTNSENFIGNFPSGLTNCFLKFKSNFNNRFFNNHIRICTFKNGKHFRTPEQEFISLFTSFNLFVYLKSAFKSINKPLNDFEIGISNDKAKRVIIFLSAFASTLKVDAKMSFTVKKTSKISKLFSRPHFNSLFDYVYNIVQPIDDCIIHGERLSEKTLDKGSDSLNSDRKTERRIRSGLPA